MIGQLGNEAPKVYIIIVNYNNWEDTIECLESVLRIHNNNYQVIIIDNGSNNNSLDELRAWSEGKYSLNREYMTDNPLKHLFSPPIKKPLPYVVISENQLGQKKAEIERAWEKHFIPYSPLVTKHSPLLFIKANKNFGYAAGCNLGCKYALSQNDFEYVWILNNDTVVANDALQSLIKKAEVCTLNNRSVGIIGSKLLIYSTPEFIQTVGGMFNKYTGKVQRIGFLERDKGFEENDHGRVNFVSGASMFFKKNFLYDVGLLDEKYFMYYEDIDWSIRALLNRREVTVCHDSKVYHKIEILSKNKKKGENPEIKYFKYRNLILLYKKYYPQLIFIAYLRLLKEAFISLVRGNRKWFYLIIRIILRKPANNFKKTDNFKESNEIHSS